MTQNICIIITARSGSKGIHKKNIYPVNGKPLITYCLEAAINTGIKNIIISTDDKNIQKICQKYDVQFLNRSIELSLSDTSSVDVVLDAVDHLESKPEIVILLQPTSPLVYPSDILEAVKVLNNGYDSCISVTSSHYKIWTQENNILNTFNHSKSNRTNRQNSKTQYLETGSIYATKYNNLINTSELLSGNVGFVEIPKIRSFEIDTHEDIMIIESIMKHEKNFFNI